MDMNSNKAMNRLKIANTYGVNWRNLKKELERRGMKMCSKCGQVKEKSEFSFTTKNIDGRKCQCKACDHKYMLQYDLVQKLKNDEKNTIELRNDEREKVNQKIKKILFPNTKIPKRKYYLHKRKNGVYYVEIINQITGKKTSAKSTGKKDKDEAVELVERWLVNGIPKKRTGSDIHLPIEHEQTVEAIILAIRKAKLTPEDAVRIIAHLTKNYINPSSDLSFLLEREEKLREIYKKEKHKYTILRRLTSDYFRSFKKENPSVSDKALNEKYEELRELKMQHILLLRRIKILRQGEKNGKEKIERG